MFNSLQTRRTFLKTAGIVMAGASASRNMYAVDARRWKVAIVQDTSKQRLGGHGLETAFRGLPDVEIIAHIDSNENEIEKRMAVSKAKRHYTTLTEMFKHETPDIVVLTSRSPDDHLEEIRQVAEKGCHIYCEKPLTASLEEADKIVKIAEKYQIKIAVAHPRRFDLGYLTMKRLVEEGKIGVPLTVQGWAKSDYRGGGEDMLVLGTHIFDLFVFFFGTPERVSAEVFVEGKPFVDQPLTRTVEPIGPAAGDEIFATFRFSNSVHGIFESRRNLYADKNFPMGITVIGSTGMLSYHFSDAHLEQQPLRFSNVPCSPDDISFAEEIPLLEDRFIPGAVPIDETFRGETITLGAVFAKARRFAVWDLIQAIQQERQPVCSVYDARTVIEMIYGVYASHVRKTPIEFPLKERIHPLLGATVPINRVALSELKGELPKGKLGNHDLSRLIMGGNLIASTAHARDLLYVSSLFKAYNTEKKVFETLILCEQAGINCIGVGDSIVESKIMNKYKKLTGSKIKVMHYLQINEKNEDNYAKLDMSLDLGTDIILVQGTTTDRLVLNNRLDVIDGMLNRIRNAGVVAGLAAHTIDSLIICEEKGIIPDVYYKTMHHDNYWSAHPRENRKAFEMSLPDRLKSDHNLWHDNCFDTFPDVTVDFVNRTQVPVIGFKVLAGGSILPEDGFKYAFENGADFICVGMFDFQIVEDVNICLNVLQNLQNRKREWYA